jgi:hypothetical protein
MPDQSQFSRWFPQLATSPYWLPNPPWTTFTPPRPPNDSWSQLSGSSDEYLPLPAPEYRPSQSNGSWQRPSRPWEQFSLPTRSVGDGLDILPTRSDSFEQNSSSSQPDWLPASASVTGGILAPFERPTGPRSPDFPGLTPASARCSPATSVQFHRRGNARSRRSAAPKRPPGFSRRQPRLNVTEMRPTTTTTSHLRRLGRCDQTPFD